ncbi:unnamed protein product, partial [Rotaria sp. Silwood1]
MCFILYTSYSIQVVAGGAAATTAAVGVPSAILAAATAVPLIPTALIIVTGIALPAFGVVALGTAIGMGTAATGTARDHSYR